MAELGLWQVLCVQGRLEGVGEPISLQEGPCQADCSRCALQQDVQGALHLQGVQMRVWCEASSAPRQFTLGQISKVAASNKGL